jgi:hypothetical protein
MFRKLGSAPQGAANRPWRRHGHRERLPPHWSLSVVSSPQWKD